MVIKCTETRSRKNFPPLHGFIFFYYYFMNGVIKVKKDQQGFGFITPADGGKDLFFHFSGCAGKVEAFNDLQEGMEVSFEVQDGQKGPMAVDVQAI